MPRSKWGAVVIAGLSVAGLFAVAYLQLRGESWDPTQPARERAVSESSPISNQDTTSAIRPDLAAFPDPPEFGGRLGVARAHLVGRVIREGEHGVAGAEVDWSALDEADLASGFDFLAEESTEESAHPTKITEVDGTFAFESRLAASTTSDSVIWASHPEWMAGSLRIPAHEQPLGGHRRIELGSRFSGTVRVVDPAGAAVEGAVIEQRGTGSAPAGTVFSADEIAELRAFRRSYQTSELGESRVHGFGGVQVMRASKGPLRSMPYVGVSKHELVLRLEQTFSASGHVRCMEPAQNGLSGFVTCTAVGNRIRTPLSISRVSADGAWSLDDVPLGISDEFVFRFDGPGSAPIEHVVRKVLADQHLEIDFHQVAATEFRVHVSDVEARPLAGIMVEATWFTDPRWTSTRARTNADGKTLLCVPADTAVSVHADSPGYVKEKLGPFSVPLPDPKIVMLELERAGRIRGKVRHLGSPVRDFEVLYWAGDPASRKAHQVNDSEDGSFLIDQSPLGEVQLLASAGLLPQSEIQKVDVVSEGEVQVSIELPEGYRGFGQVVDALSGAPLMDAVVLLTNSHGRDHLSYRGPEIRVDGEGRFSGSYFSPGRNLIWVRAQDYSLVDVSAFAVANQPLDFGVISMTRTQRLTVRLISSGDADFRRYSIQSSGSPLIAKRSFPADGVRVCEGVPWGALTLQLSHPDGSEELDELTLLPGRPWNFVREVEGGGGIEIICEALDESSLPEYAQVHFLSREGHGSSRTTRVDSHGRASMEGLIEGDVAIDLCDGGWRCIKTVFARVEAAETKQIRISLGRQSLHLVILDSERVPVPEAEVRLMSPDYRATWQRVLRSDGDGRCEAGDLEMDNVAVFVSHPTLGTSAPQVVDLLTHPKEPVEIVIEQGRPLRLRLEDHGLPCSGVQISVQNSAGLGLDLLATNEQGIAITHPLGVGDYQIQPLQPGYWPGKTKLRHQPSEGTHLIPVRRLGAIEFMVRNPAGLPIAGQAIDLRSIEFNMSVREWASAGAVELSLADLQTDLEGKARFEALPNGPFEWRMAFSDGTVRSGSVMVPPKALATEVMVVP